jgi:hypothetical protein
LVRHCTIRIWIDSVYILTPFPEFESVLFT